MLTYKRGDSIPFDIDMTDGDGLALFSPTAVAYLRVGYEDAPATYEEVMDWTPDRSAVTHTIPSSATLAMRGPYKVRVHVVEESGVDECDAWEETLQINGTVLAKAT